jgi:DNA-binding MarR family transcriptional regulator
VNARLTELELAAWQALLHAHDHVTRVLDAELRAEHGIGLGDYDVLLRLARADGGRLKMTELARRAMLPPSSLVRVVDRLVARGLVARDRSDADSRVVHACLTDAGRSRVRRAAGTHLRGIRRHFTGLLTEEQLQAVADALGVISGPHEPH